VVSSLNLRIGSGDGLEELGSLGLGLIGDLVEDVDLAVVPAALLLAERKYLTQGRPDA